MRIEKVWIGKAQHLAKWKILKRSVEEKVIDDGDVSRQFRGSEIVVFIPYSHHCVGIIFNDANPFYLLNPSSLTQSHGEASPCPASDGKAACMAKTLPTCDCFKWCLLPKQSSNRIVTRLFW